MGHIIYGFKEKAVWRFSVDECKSLERLTATGISVKECNKITARTNQRQKY